MSLLKDACLITDVKAHTHTTRGFLFVSWQACRSQRIEAQIVSRLRDDNNNTSGRICNFPPNHQHVNPTQELVNVTSPTLPC